jgi:mRNA interferase MazF
MKGKIVLVRFPFTDLTATKLRPALVIHANRDDIVAAFISSRAPPRISLPELIIPQDHPDFPATGLKVSSVIRFDKIATVSCDLIEGEIGEVSGTLIGECNGIMSQVFQL